MINQISSEPTDSFPFHLSNSLFSRCHVQLLATPWITACQASLSFTVSYSLLRFMTIDSVMLSNHLIQAVTY